MSIAHPTAIVAGHICIDIIPAFPAGGATLADLLVPGKLINTGPVVTATGGAVSNTGLALHRLGVETRLMGKVGDDLFGHAILDILRGYGSMLTGSMIVDPAATSSYTIVINPPDVDRIFLHSPAANDTFSAADVPDEALATTRLFHFGYPPAMQRMFEAGGEELITLMRRAKAAGAVTSLDASYPDPFSAAGQVDWQALLARVLPYVDVYLPSLEETIFMLDRPRHDAMRARGDLIGQTDGSLLDELSARLLEMGAAVVGLKLGEQGFFVRTTADPQRLTALAPLLGNRLGEWQNRALLAPCFQVKVAGTTGAGDSTIAGFLTGLLHGLSLEDALTLAVGVGACSVEQADASSGIPPWQEVQARIAAGWSRRSVDLDLPGWRQDAGSGLFKGPFDRTM
jgi:sugar/nucleoside kinase (ribokinase family)